MRKYIITAILFGLLCGHSYAQSTLKGTISPKALRNGIHPFCLNSKTSSYGVCSATDSTGSFLFENLPEGYYSLATMSPGFYYYDTSFHVRGDDVELNIVLTENPDFNAQKIYNREYVDNFSFIFGFNFLSPDISDDDKLFGSIYSINFGIELRFLLTKKLKIGFRWEMLQASWMNLVKESILDGNKLEKQRYVEVGTGLKTFLHYDFVKVKNIRRLTFCDLGFGYYLPYSFDYKGFKAQDVYSGIQGITKYNDFRTFFRFGYRHYAIAATYRLTDIMKKDFPEPPKLQIGIEFLLP